MLLTLFAAFVQSPTVDDKMGCPESDQQVAADGMMPEEGALKKSGLMRAFRKLFIIALKPGLPN